MLSKVEIPLLPLDEQRHIAAILDKADGLRRKRNRALDLLDSLTQSIFLEMFGRPGDRASAVRQRPLGELAELINGDRSSNYPSGDDIVGEGILFLNTTNITPEGLDLATASYITEKKFASLTRGKLKQGDIVITLRGSLGQTAIFENAGDTGFINAQMMIIRPKKDIEARYLLQALQLDDMLAHFKKAGSGSAVPQLTAKQMSCLEIPVPDLVTQRTFGDRRQALRKVRTAAMLEKKKLDSLFSSLQHRAFSGKL
jgi:type I restriction enzyme S subunit